MHRAFLTLTLDSYFIRLLQENSVLQEQWVDEYGSTITYKSFLGVRLLVYCMEIFWLAHSDTDESTLYYGHKGD